MGVVDKIALQYPSSLIFLYLFQIMLVQFPITYYTTFHFDLYRIDGEKNKVYSIWVELPLLKLFFLKECKL